MGNLPGLGPNSSLGLAVWVQGLGFWVPGSELRVQGLLWPARTSQRNPKDPKLSLGLPIPLDVQDLALRRRDGGFLEGVFLSAVYVGEGSRQAPPSVGVGGGRDPKPQTLNPKP